MWLIVIALGLVVLLSFSFVLLFGAPYLPTLDKQVATALKLADLKPGECLLELGSGDGKVLIAVAQRGIRAVGYELNPLLVVISWLRTRRYRHLVSVRWGNFLSRPWPPADAIFIFGLARIMPRVDKKVIQSSSSPVKLVSFAFAVPGRKADKEVAGVYLYLYRYSKT